MKLNSAKSRNLELFQKNCTKLKLGCSSKIDDAWNKYENVNVKKAGILLEPNICNDWSWTETLENWDFYALGQVFYHNFKIIITWIIIRTMQIFAEKN